MIETDNLPTLSKSDLLHQSIDKALVIIGSNNNAKTNIALAIVQLSNLWQIKQLNTHLSADHTGKSDSLYLNTAVIINFNKFISAEMFYHTLKNLESLSGRIKNSPIVSLDLDIIAIHTTDWHIIKERLPLKAHEMACMQTTNTIKDFF